MKASDFEKEELIARINSCPGRIGIELRKFVKQHFSKNALSLAESNKQLTAKNKELSAEIRTLNAVNDAKIAGYESQVS